ncbi:MAG: hemerythrin domain-containing protein [Sphingobium sp.]|nr:hemerythrin domain-containing protein [Sphingobium sp.]
MYDLMTLMEQHDRLDALADQLVARARDHGSPAAECAAVLAEMEAILATHLVAEAEFLYDRARADNDNDFAATLADFEQDFSLLDEHWHQFVRDWTVERIAADRASFQSQASDILTALKLRIARENAVLYPMALEKGRIALRPGA